MASSKDTRVFFVPYRPGTTQSYEDGEMSQQKHAAREYHRKAKERRRALKKSKQAIVSPRQDEGVPLPFSPREILGAGRVDPLNSLPVSNMSSYAQEMLDFSLTYQWQVFCFCNPEATVQDMKQYVMCRILSSETSLYAIVFAGATYQALRQPGRCASQENLLLRFNYKTRALTNMRQQIKEFGPDVPNETLYTMLSLAAFGAVEWLQLPAYEANDAPLAAAHDLDFYSRLPCEWAHLRVLFHLLRQRGGHLAAVNRPGFFVAIGLYDVLTSFQRLERPAFPPCESTKQIMARWPSQIGEPIHLTYSLGIGFKSLSAAAPFAGLHNIIEYAVEATIAWERYLRHTSGGPSLYQIIQGRTAILHDLLCLADLSANVQTADECLYELCRLAALAYMLIFLYPLSRGNGPHEELAKRLKSVLELASSMELWLTDSNFLMWATFMGGIVARDNPLRPWFAHYLAKSGCNHTLSMWEQVGGALSSYLWLENECAAEGLRFWREIWVLASTRTVNI